jgi:hypothetical protein
MGRTKWMKEECMKHFCWKHLREVLFGTYRLKWFDNIKLYLR